VTVTDLIDGLFEPSDTATFSTDRVYRYHLGRSWSPGGKRMNFVMLNPSTADAFNDDATIRRCVGFSAAGKFGSLVVTNLFAFRSTDPRGLRQAEDPIGPDNDAAILDAAHCADLVVAAWGTHGSLHGRGDQVRAMLTDAGVELHVLRLTKAGHPGHPLYVPASTTPEPWTVARAVQGDV
jgi:hypothetical protein